MLEPANTAELAMLAAQPKTKLANIHVTILLANKTNQDGGILSILKRSVLQTLYQIVICKAVTFEQMIITLLTLVALKITMNIDLSLNGSWKMVTKTLSLGDKRAIRCLGKI